MAYQSVSAHSDHGSAEGYEVETSAENLENWLARYDLADPALLKRLRSEHRRVAILKNINVDEAHRGEGHGSALLSEWLGDTTATLHLLVADSGESQSEGFDLVAFYQGFGFEVVQSSTSGPLMALGLD